MERHLKRKTTQRLKRTTQNNPLNETLGRTGTLLEPSEFPQVIFFQSDPIKILSMKITIPEVFHGLHLASQQLSNGH